MECTLSLKTYQLGISSSQHGKNLFFSKKKLVYMNLHHVLTSTRRFRADETFFSFPNGFSNLSNSRFRSLIGRIQAIKLRNENSIGRKRPSNFMNLYLAYRKCNKSTKLRSFLAYFTRQKQFFQKTLKISAPNSFFQKMPKFFYLMLNFFNKFH